MTVTYLVDAHEQVLHVDHNTEETVQLIFGDRLQVRHVQCQRVGTGPQKIYIQKDPLHFPNIRNKSSTELKGTKSKKKKFVNSAAF